MKPVIKEIHALNKKAEELKEKAALNMRKALGNLHKEMGFSTRQALVKALNDLPNGDGSGVKNTRVDAALIAKVRSLEKTLTDAEIANKLGIKIATVEYARKKGLKK